MFQAIKRAWQQAKEQYAMSQRSALSAATNPAVAAFREEVLAAFPYREEAKAWRTAVASGIPTRTKFSSTPRNTRQRSMNSRMPGGTIGVLGRKTR